MSASGAARLQIVAIGGTNLDLSWLNDLTIPAGVRVEIAELSSRIDLVLTSGANELAVIIDLLTGLRLAEQRAGRTAELEELLDRMVSRRLAQAGGRDDAPSRWPLIFERVNWPLDASQVSRLRQAPDPAPGLDESEGRTDAEE